jgi:hypothetical protein
MSIEVSWMFLTLVLEMPIFFCNNSVLFIYSLMYSFIQWKFIVTYYINIDQVYSGQQK